MAYIGRPLQVANLAVQSGTGDGSDTTPIATLDYATTTNGIAVYLDGVRQLAGTDFNVTAQTTLTFTTAPANGVGVDVYFLGLELSLPTPADATVTSAKLASDAVTGAKIADDAIDSEHYTDGSIDTAHIADDQITLAKMAPGTDGNIITYDASGNPAAVATGSAGQVLTSAGAGAPPTFAAAAGGGVIFLGSTSSGSQRDYTSQISSDYDHYLMVFQLLGDNAGNNMAIQVYASSSLVTSSSYSWANQVNESDSSGYSGNASNGDDMMRMAQSGQQNASSLVGFFYFNKTYPNFNGQITYRTSSGFMGSSTFGGMYNSQAAITGIRLLMDGGVFQGGTARLYGVVNS